MTVTIFGRNVPYYKTVAFIPVLSAFLIFFYVLGLWLVFILMNPSFSLAEKFHLSANSTILEEFKTLRNFVYAYIAFSLPIIGIFYAGTFVYRVFKWAQNKATDLYFPLKAVTLHVSLSILGLILVTLSYALASLVIRLIGLPFHLKI